MTLGLDRSGHRSSRDFAMNISLPISINLPDGFLNAEERCGFVVNSRQKRVFAVQLDLLAKFFEVCRKHDIKAVAFAGTMLGAVRHRGFIPWDDDADVCMDRENFEKLRALPENVFQPPYFLQTCFSDRRFFCPYARLRNSLTTGAIVGEDYPDYNNGIYIDIFVLDGYSRSRFFAFVQRMMRSWLVECISALGRSSFGPKPFYVRCIHAFRPLWEAIGYNRLVKAYDKVLSVATPSADRLSMMTHDDFFVSRYWMLKNEFYDVIDLPFETLMLPVPRSYDAILRRTYGDYMEFPPMEKRGAWHENQLLMDPHVPYEQSLSSNTSMRKAWFVTFADSRMKQPLRRIRRQAEAMGFSPDRILVMTERDLDEDFKDKMAAHLVKGSRGFGCWCWRPQVVLQALRQMSDGEILLYCDAGCHLNAKGLPRLREYLAMADESDMLAFQGRSLLGGPRYDPMHHFNPIGMWTKGDVIDSFGVREDKELLSSGQYSGGVFLVKKTPRTVAFYERYLAVALQHFEFFDDSPSVAPNPQGFVAHRHDQAVFTLLCMQEGVRTLSTCEYGIYANLAPEHYRGDRSWSRLGFDDMDEFPVHAMRDTTFGWRALLPRPVRQFGLKVLSLLSSCHGGEGRG